MMPLISLVATGVMILGTALLVLSEGKKILWLRAVSKVMAATGFLVVGWSHGALDTTYGQLLMGGLALCWVGDMLLLSHDEPVFLAGIGAFLLGHVGYAAAFVALGLSVPWAMGSAVVLLGIAAGVMRWLLPHVEGLMKKAVIAYVVVIVAMVTLALGAFGMGCHWLIPGGAIMFFLSDLSVARDRFVSPAFVNGAWGLPAYFLAQWMLATSAGTV